MKRFHIHLHVDELAKKTDRPAFDNRMAVAAAISLFESGAALATVVGVLIEVPLMLLVVRVVNGSKGWYAQGKSQQIKEARP